MAAPGEPVREAMARAVGPAMARAVGPAIDGALISRYQPDFVALLLGLLGRRPLDPAAAPWLHLYRARLQHRRDGEHRAEAEYRRALAGLGNPALRARISLALGSSQIARGGDARQALADLELSDRLYRTVVDDPEAARRASVALLQAAHLTGSFLDRAAGLDPESLVTDDAIGSADRLLRIGILYRQNGHLDRAIAMRGRAQALIAAANAPISLAETTIALSDALAASGRWDAAIASYRRARRLMRDRAARGPADYATRFHTASAEIGLARAALLGQKLPRAALRHAAAARAILSADAVIHHLAITGELTGWALEAIGRRDEALAAYGEAIDLHERRHNHRRALPLVARHLRLVLRAGRLRPAVADLRRLTGPGTRGWAAGRARGWIRRHLPRPVWQKGRRVP